MLASFCLFGINSLGPHRPAQAEVGCGADSALRRGLPACNSMVRSMAELAPRGSGLAVPLVTLLLASLVNGFGGLSYLRKDLDPFTMNNVYNNPDPLPIGKTHILAPEVIGNVHKLPVRARTRVFCAPAPACKATHCRQSISVGGLGCEIICHMGGNLVEFQSMLRSMNSLAARLSRAA